MLIGHSFRVKYQARQKLWRFPQDRFVAYGPEDEWWARKYDFGREVESEVVVEIPHAILVGITADGVAEFRAIPVNNYPFLLDQ